MKIQLLLFLVLPANVHAVFAFLGNIYNGFLGLLDPALDPVWDFLARRTCKAVESLFVLQDFLDCDCNGDFSFSGGLEAGILCGLSEQLCLSPPFFCGTSSFEADWTSANGFTKTRACFEINSGLPDNIPIIGDSLKIPELCIQGDPSPQDKYCRIDLGSSRCRSCEICGSFDVTFDCSNVDINPFPDFIGISIPGPNLNGNCVGLGLIFDLVSTPPASIRSFGMPEND